MNPMMMIKLKTMFDKFRINHPKVIGFFSAASNKVAKDSVIEIKLTSPEGETILTNMRVTDDDIELMNEFINLITIR